MQSLLVTRPQYGKTSNSHPRLRPLRPARRPQPTIARAAQDDFSSIPLLCQPSPPEELEGTIVLMADPSPQALPARVSLKGRFGKIKHQGNVGSCTAHAATSCVEYLYGHWHGQDEWINMSPRFEYYNSLEVKCPPVGGIHIAGAMKTLQQYGACPEASCSSQPTTKAHVECTEPPSNAYAAASRFKMGDIRLVAPYMDTFKGYLANRNTIVVGIPIYKAFHTVRDRVPMPQGRSLGYHAVLIVGYDDALQAWEIHNSWGQQWGKGGYAYLPYGYPINHDAHSVLHTAAYRDRKFKRADIGSAPDQLKMKGLIEVKSLDDAARRMKPDW